MPPYRVHAHSHSQRDVAIAPAARHLERDLCLPRRQAMGGHEVVDDGQDVGQRHRRFGRDPSPAAGRHDARFQTFGRVTPARGWIASCTHNAPRAQHIGSVRACAAWRASRPELPSQPKPVRQLATRVRRAPDVVAALLVHQRQVAAGLLRAEECAVRPTRARTLAALRPTWLRRRPHSSFRGSPGHCPPLPEQP